MPINKYIKKRAKRFKGKPINIIPIGWSFENKEWGND